VTNSASLVETTEVQWGPTPPPPDKEQRLWILFDRILPASLNNRLPQLPLKKTQTLTVDFVSHNSVGNVTK
jgi:hypothetical protein